MQENTDNHTHPNDNPAPPSEAGQNLFVYGSLAPGEVNEYVLAPLQGSWQDAHLHGLFDPEGWGLCYGFPSLKLDDKADAVAGKLFTSPQLADHWWRLDEFEGPAYKRAVATIFLPDGASCEASVYTLNEDRVY